MARLLPLHSTDDSIRRQELLARFRAGKDMARGYADGIAVESRLSAARAFCREMVEEYWNETVRGQVDWPVANCAVQLEDVPEHAEPLAKLLGATAASLDNITAGYLLGTVYTALLPGDLRSRWGAYYTPPQYVQRLLDQVEIAGINWRSARAADPACGGGAFLAPVAARMLRANQRGGAKLVLADISSRLHGFELDPFAAWMSQVTLEIAMLEICIQAGRRMPNVVEVGDSLRLDQLDQFDVVIGNPPYGRVTLPEGMREKYARSLFGHANLYGIFTDLAVRLCKRGGVIAFVTPTSLLSGQYFKSLRSLLIREAPPRTIDFISERVGIFDDVLQETMLAVYARGSSERRVGLCALRTTNDGQVEVEQVDTLKLTEAEGPWILSRRSEQAAFFHSLPNLSARLADYGYTVSTGPLVWNRHKPQLRYTRKDRERPIIWAEAISSSGFSFSAEKINHAPFIEVYESQPHLVTRVECVLVQRTTAKEQQRRLVCAFLPKSFIAKYDGVVVENHLNMIRSVVGRKAVVLPKTIMTVLNSATVDLVFRCISGSVAVSAYELEALPLPNATDMVAIQEMIESRASARMIERRISKAYGLNHRREMADASRS